MTDQTTGAPPPDPSDPVSAPESRPAEADPTATDDVEEVIEGGSVSVSQPEPEGATEEDHERAEAAEEDDDAEN